MLAPIPLSQIQNHNTPPEKLAASYDIIVAGAGTAGWAAAIQAARLGAKVLLLEESDWIGGQMAAAAVTSMDEQGCWDKFPVRERGLYKEFHESITNYYCTHDKDPYRAYYSWPVQREGGYEPKVARAILYAFIANERAQGRTLDLATGATITAVAKTNDCITGVTITHGVAQTNKNIACKVLIEATEYGDILPLAKVPYRLGAGKSGNLDPECPVQSHTWLAVIREYPGGLPEHLRIPAPPPGYEPKRYRKTQLHGRLIWGSPGKDYKGPRTYRVLLAWRGMADIDSPSTGLATENRHTQAGLNGGYQDYPVNVRSIEDSHARRDAERDGIYRTLSIVYYLQQLGLDWGLAEDEGYDTPCNRRMMAARNLRPDLLPIARRLPCHPYVRESRRAIGLYTLKTADMGRFENAAHFQNSVAMGDYFMDIDHGKTAAFVEKDLDPERPAREGGPFQIPFEVFIPRTTDGLVLAEKNISQSRIVNGATRLQPVTMLNGQAAGAIAAHAVLGNLQPRAVNPIAVQATLLAARANLIQRWHEDLPHGSPLWQAVQLLSLHNVIDTPAPFDKQPGRSIGHGNHFNPAAPAATGFIAPALARLARLSNKTPPQIPAAKTHAWADLDPALTHLDPGWRQTPGIDPGAATPV
ncbi:MAG: FAD-dependent oxidoreductase, partial [Opitutaceae bacterium]|nr:FAD-dependent oxidoreductase [Opitutaceae bacterium]